MVREVLPKTSYRRPLKQRCDPGVLIRTWPVSIVDFCGSCYMNSIVGEKNDGAITLSAENPTCLYVS